VTPEFDLNYSGEHSYLYTLAVATCDNSILHPRRGETA